MTTFRKIVKLILIKFSMK